MLRVGWGPGAAGRLATARRHAVDRAAATTWISRQACGYPTDLWKTAVRPHAAMVEGNCDTSAVATPPVAG